MVVGQQPGAGGLAELGQGLVRAGAMGVQLARAAVILRQQPIAVPQQQRPRRARPVDPLQSAEVERGVGPIKAAISPQRTHLGYQAPNNAGWIRSSTGRYAELNDAPFGSPDGVVT